eukprot:COSAG06_NODE_15902_length_1036_cov_1.278549_1_plen_105_part_10
MTAHLHVARGAKHLHALMRHHDDDLPTAMASRLGMESAVRPTVDDVVANLQLRRQLATAEARATHAEQAVEQATKAMREREARLRRQFQGKLRAAEQELRTEAHA